MKTKISPELKQRAKEIVTKIEIWIETNSPQLIDNVVCDFLNRKEEKELQKLVGPFKRIQDPDDIYYLLFPGDLILGQSYLCCDRWEIFTPKEITYTEYKSQCQIKPDQKVLNKYKKQREQQNQDKQKLNRKKQYDQLKKEFE